MESRFQRDLMAMVLIFLPVMGFSQFMLEQDYPESTASLSISQTIVPPGTELRAELLLSIPPNWHTYWSNPGDGGAAAIIDWSLPEGFIAGDPIWPLPWKYQEDQSLIFGLEGDVPVSIPISVTRDVPDGSYVIGVDVEWLYCGTVCIPGFAELSVEVNVDGSLAQAEGTGHGIDSYSLLESRIIRTDNKIEIYVSASALSGYRADQLWFYPEGWGMVDQSSTQFWVRSGDNYVGSMPSGPILSDRISGLLVGHREDVPLEGFSIDSAVEAGN